MKTKMKQLTCVLMLALAVTAGSSVGCAAATAWWQNFESNPVAQVQSLEQTVQVTLSSAQVAFAVILPLLPAASQAQAQADFANAVVSVNHTLQALNDAVQAAVAAQTPNPDFTTVIAAVESAIQQIVAIVDQYTAKLPPTTNASVRYIAGSAEAHAGVTSLSRFRTKF